MFRARDNNVNCTYVSPHEVPQCDTHSSSVLNFNIRSMFRNFNNFRSEILHSTLPDVIGLCETRLIDSSEKLYPLPNFNLFATNISSNKGGVGLFIKDTIKCRPRSNLSIKTDHLESIFIECYINNHPIVIGMCYRRDGTPMQAFQEDLSTIIEQINSNCIIMGDFNIDLLKSDEEASVRDFINTMHEFAFKPIVTKPTRVFNNSATLLDHIWVNFEPVRNFHTSIILSGITDHFPVVYHMQTGNTSYINKKMICYRKRGEDCENRFRVALENSDLDEVLNIDDVDEAFLRFNTTLQNIYNDAFPMVSKEVSLKNLNNPWLTRGLIESIRNKNRLYKKFVRKPITYGNLYKTYRNNLTKIIKAAKNQYCKQKFNECNGNIKKTWELVNSLTGKNKSNKTKVFKINGEFTEDDEIIANTFNDY